MSNVGGNTGRNLKIPDNHDESWQLLPDSVKEYLKDRDIGGVNATQVLGWVQEYGEAKTLLAIRVEFNIMTYEKYGRNHPNFDPRLPYKRVRR